MKNKKVKRGEIWVAKIGVNIGSEISKDGKYLRPVLVMSNHMGGDLVGIIPITTKYNKNYDKFLIEIRNYQKYGLKEKSYFSINNFKTISLKRLTYKINDKYVEGKLKFIIKNDLLKFLSKKIIDIYNL
ncbi:MAG: type II toxin-antitoxin system PemK/MazF family toxin [Candidatus Gracilibacteria bacterium]|nr:type II toxin-antitoxin system PemK/MazF family toxin [Candidatus Gracilibacteria bacterium]